MKIILILVTSFLVLLNINSILSVTHIDPQIKYKNGMIVIKDKSTGKFTNIIPPDYKKEPYHVYGYNCSCDGFLENTKNYRLWVEKTKRLCGIPWVTKRKMYVEYDPQQPSIQDRVEKYIVDSEQKNSFKLGCTGVILAISMGIIVNDFEDII